tara:strand:+ start:3116 stop:3985 length:870 start_codon:yes stop_codon:yes gene_type:complete
MTTTLLGVQRGTPEATLESGDVTRTIYNRTFVVFTDSPANDDEYTVLNNTTGLPSLNDTWSGNDNADSNAICKSLSVINDEKNRSYWYVTAAFDSNTDAAANSNSGNSSPVNLDDDVDWDFETIEEVVHKDINGKAVATSADERFTSPPITRIVPISVVTYSRWQTAFAASTIHAYVGKINGPVFLGFATKVAMCAGIRARLRRIRGVPLWRVTYVFKFNPFTWVAEVLNQGSYYYEDGATEPTPFTDKRGHRTTGNLTLTGGKAAKGFTFYRKFDVHKLVDFNPLIFP